MVGKTKRKKSGGRKRRHSKVRKTNYPGKFTKTTLGDKKVKHEKTLGGNQKKKLKSGKEILVNNPDTGESEKRIAKDVLDNEADPDFARRDIITKGAILGTEQGKIRVTSRPGQDGILTGIPVED